MPKAHTRATFLAVVLAVGLTACTSSNRDEESESASTESSMTPANNMASDYKRDVPDSLAALAKFTEAQAADIARGQVPGGVIESVELEEEGGVLLYSYDLRVPSKEGIDEVHIDAKTGAVIKVTHESPEDEKAEAEEAATIPKQ